RGLKLPDAKAKEAKTEAYNARAMLVYYYLNTRKYPEAYREGKAFAEGDPRAGQAALAAGYALQAAARMLEERERKGATGDELKEDRDRLLDLARFLETRWPKELPGDLARHQTAALFLREKKLPEAIAVL